jgi:hypothetical protein
MRSLFVSLLLFVILLRGATAQPANCATEPSVGSTLPLSLDLAGRPGVPKGFIGQAYVDLPIGQPGVACRDASPPPRDILRGERGDVLGPSSPDLLRGPGNPHVWVEVR